MVTCTKVCESGAEETLRHFLKKCHGLGGIREIHEVREADEIEELLLFCDHQDKKKIGYRKKFLEAGGSVHSVEGEDEAGAAEVVCEGGTRSGEV